VHAIKPRETLTTSSSTAACNVYISEGQRREVIDSLTTTAAGLPGAVLANVFQDEPYNRSNFTFVSTSPAGIASAASTFSRTALGMLNLRQHSATHPRLGIVDHISCHPLTQPQAHITHAAETARAIAESLGTGPRAVPTYLYGAAHPAGTELADIRRRLGYFARGPGEAWQGPMAGDAAAKNVPDFGPTAVPPESGVCCVGACGWIINYNVLLGTHDMALARQVTRAVSQRAGGLPSVQAMALKHAEGIEVACNLLDWEKVSPEQVHAAIETAASLAGVPVLAAYQTGKDIDALIKLAA